MSIINNISNFILSKKESPIITKQFLNWNQLSNVILVAYDHQLSNCVDFINACKNDKISVTVAVIYDGKPEQAPKPNFDHLILDKKQFSLFALPKDEYLKKLNIKTSDVLINLGNHEQLKAFALTKLSQAKCKIGNFESPVFDITINTDKTVNSSEFLKQVIVYLNMIKPTANL